MRITRAQIRSAIGHLGINQKILAEAIGMERSGISKYLNSTQGEVHLSTLDKIYTYFDNRGIVFLDNKGVAEKPSNEIRELEGKDGFAAFMDDVYNTIAEFGGDICVSNVDERNWISWMTQDGYDAHVARMNALPPNYNFKIFIKEGDDFFIASKIAKYRYLPSEFFTDQSFYVYGDKLALIAFGQSSVRINIINNASWSLSFRNLFSYAWVNTPQIKDKK